LWVCCSFPSLLARTFIPGSLSACCPALLAYVSARMDPEIASVALGEETGSALTLALSPSSSGAGLGAVQPTPGGKVHPSLKRVFFFVFLHATAIGMLVRAPANIAYYDPMQSALSASDLVALEFSCASIPFLGDLRPQHAAPNL
jgi:hypothetical protein